MPTDVVEGLILAAFPERESSCDVLISRTGSPLEQLPPGAAVGTGSLRRCAQLLHRRADLVMRDIRGNVDTRLKKLAADEFDAIVLAEAGLKRLGLESHVTQIFEAEVLMPAVGQGALAIETRADDAATAPSSSGSIMYLPIGPCWPSDRCWRLWRAGVRRRSALGPA